jgi:hypothetical protein
VFRGCIFDVGYIRNLRIGRLDIVLAPRPLNIIGVNINNHFDAGVKTMDMNGQVVVRVKTEANAVESE